MPRLHELEFGSKPQEGENTTLTDAVFPILRAAGLPVLGVLQGPAGETGFPLEVTFAAAPTIEEEGAARKLLDLFAGREVRWEKFDHHASIEIPRVAPTDEFELLDVAYREDSYTALIARAFRGREDFRRGFLGFLGLKDAADWAVAHRKVVEQAVPESKTKRKRRAPDLVLFSRSLGSLVVIEAKVRSAEGIGQTDAYSAPSFLARLAEKVGVTLDSPRVQLVFLTPDGTLPEQSPGRAEFRPVRFDEIADRLPAGADDSLGRLASTLRARMHERALWPKPGDTADVFSYLGVGWGLVTDLRRLELLCDAMEDGTSWPELRRFGQSNNPTGAVYYAQYLEKCWEQAGKGDDPGWSVHLELVWSPGSPDLTLYVHHETCPYRPRKVLGRAAELHEAHSRFRANFLDGFEGHRRHLKAAGWKVTPNRGKWSQASYKIRGDVAVAALRDRLAALVDAAIEPVRSGVRKLQAR